MPVVSVFFGIVIRMFYQEHEPAHFHAERHGQRATFDFSGKLVAGQLQSRTARRLIREWAAPAGTRDELGKNQVGRTTRTNSATGVTSMVFLPSVVDAKHEGGFRIRLTFNDGLRATIDFERWLTGPVCEPVRAPRYFSRFYIDGGGLAWPNGADIAPETLYAAARSERSNTRLHPTAAVREKPPTYRAVKRRRG